CFFIFFYYVYDCNIQINYLNVNYIRLNLTTLEAWVEIPLPTRQGLVKIKKMNRVPFKVFERQLKTYLNVRKVHTYFS
ncbi:MAG: hypothetical protein ACJARP_003216, partial [Vicingaceae bacterium]